MSREGKILLAVVLILIGLGLVILYSASALTSADRYEDEHHFLRRQAMWAGLGMILLAALSRLDYRRWVRWSPWIAGAAIVLLILVLIPKVGTSVNGARRWLRFGPVNLQVSEFARVAALLLMVKLLCRPNFKDDFLRGFLPVFGFAALTAGLIFLEPDFGGALFTMALLTAVMLAGGIRLIHLVPTCAAAMVALTTIALTRLDYVVKRFKEHYFQQDLQGVGYQLHQSLIALGAGGLFGQGLGRGLQKLRFLPEPHSDFILAILGEELGLLGTLSVLGLFAIFAVTGCRIALRAADPEGRLLAFGITVMITFQAVINVGVVTGVFPTKGMPLPFISYGGSSILALSAAMGILMNIANQPRIEEAPGT